MSSFFIIIEIDSGLTVAQVPANGDPEAAAAEENGTLIDPGPFPSYEEAYDALLAIPSVEDETAGDG